MPLNYDCRFKELVVGKIKQGNGLQPFRGMQNKSGLQKIC